MLMIDEERIFPAGSSWRGDGDKEWIGGFKGLVEANSIGRIEASFGRSIETSVSCGIGKTVDIGDGIFSSFPALTLLAIFVFAKSFIPNVFL
jgi:hypothetical protein